MEIAIGDGDVVRHNHPLPDANMVRTHEHRADQRRVVAHLHLTGWLDAEFSPGIDLHAPAENQARLAPAAEAFEAVFALSSLTRLR